MLIKSRMLCCLLAALFSGNVAAAGQMAVGLARKPTAAKFLVFGALAGGAALLAPVVVAHAGQYAERAAVHDRSVLEEFLAQPLCTGAPRHDDRATARRKTS
jgi:hypothetical protein